MNTSFEKKKTLDLFCHTMAFIIYIYQTIGITIKLKFSGSIKII